MMRFLYLISLLLLVSIAYSQEETKKQSDFKHFDIGVSLLFWSPNDVALQARNSNFILEHNGLESGNPVAVGYGNGIGGELQLSYSFKPLLGLQLAFDFIQANNNTDFDAYHPNDEKRYINNRGSYYNLKIGYFGKTNLSGLLNLYIGTGFNYLVAYHLSHKANYEPANPDWDNKGSAFGYFAQTGIIIRINKRIYFKSGMEYSYLPILEDDPPYEAKTDFGGISGKIGIGINF